MSPYSRVDEVIEAIARRQHGVVSIDQLRAAGISDEAIRRRIAGKQLTPLHRAVFRLGPTVAPLARYMAAVLACGPTAVLSHASAAALHGLIEDRGEPVDVTVTTNRKSRRGIKVHRTRRLAKGEVTRTHGIPVTTHERTLRDLAVDGAGRELARAVDGAHFDPTSLTDAVERGRGRRGITALRAAAQRDNGFTRSEAERTLRDLVRRAGLPLPTMNTRVGRWEVDALWPDQRLIVEVDGFAYHSSRWAFERDRRKDAELQELGWRVLRVTWRQLVEEPEAVVARIARALG